MARIAIIGGGITGLSAAWEVERAGHEAVIFEAADRLGGKLQRSPVPGLGFPLDEGADAFLARVPDALELCDELGIDELVHPTACNAWVYAGDRLHPLPSAQLLGLPTDLDEVARSGLLSTDGLGRARQDLTSDAAPIEEDVSVGSLIRERLGDEVCDHLVEPLLGGINGGSADGLSLEATAPQLWACARRGGSLIRAAAEMRAAATGDARGEPPPVFAAPAQGMAELPTRLAERVQAEVRLRATVAPVQIRADRSRPVDINGERFDGAVLAVPADVAGSLLCEIDTGVTGTLEAITFASVVMVTLVADADRVDHALDGSGFVTARTAGTSITACSWGSSKWAHWSDGDHVVFRASLGHDGDTTDWAGHDDEDLVATVRRDLGTVMGVDIDPVGVRIGRWPHSFPQYRPGHVARVADVRQTLAAAGPVAVAGMSFDGIGVPASIRGGRTAARTVLG